MFQEILAQKVMGNTVSAYLYSLGFFVLCFIIIILLKKIAISKLKAAAAKTKLYIDDFIINVSEKTRS